MAVKDFATGRSDLYKIDPTKINVKDDWNSRDASDPANAEHIEQLAASIKEIGVKTPLVCYEENKTLYLTDGHCRHAAVMKLLAAGIEIKTVPVIVEDKGNEADRLFRQVISQGKSLGAIELAKLFQRLLGYGWLQKDIAVKSGMSGGRVSQILELLTLPDVLQKFIVEGTASASMVLAMFKKHKGDVTACVLELTGAVVNANKAGRKRAMPKDTEGSEGGENSEGKATAPRSNLKSYIKSLVEKAYAEERIDDTEEMVTMSLSENDWAELMEMIDY